MTRLALGGEVRSRSPGADRRRGEQLRVHQRGERGHADAGAGLAEEMPAGHCAAVLFVELIGFIALYSLVIVSSRLRIMLATVVQAASSGSVEFGVGWRFADC